MCFAFSVKKIIESEHILLILMRKAGGGKMTEGQGAMAFPKVFPFTDHPQEPKCI
jgi:hypothetical protein